MNIDFTLLRSFYHISPEGADHPSFEMPAAEFLNPDKAREAMLELGKLYRAVGMELPVSFTGMTFFNLCMTRLLANVQSDRPLRLALADLTFQLEQHNDHAHAGYRVDKLVGLEPPDDPRLRETFGRDSWIGLFRDTITPAVEAVAAAAGYKPAMIWNQFGAQIGNMCTTILERSNPNCRSCSTANSACWSRFPAKRSTAAAIRSFIFPAISTILGRRRMGATSCVPPAACTTGARTARNATTVRTCVRTNARNAASSHWPDNNSTCRKPTVARRRDRLFWSWRAAGGMGIITQ